MAFVLCCDYVLLKNKSAVGRISIVDQNQNFVYSSFVFQNNVVDYQFKITGIRPCDLINAPTEKLVRESISKILFSKIIVGYNLQQVFDSLEFYPDLKLVRDLSHLFDKSPRDIAGTKKICLDSKFEYPCDENAVFCILIYNVTKEWDPNYDYSDYESKKRVKSMQKTMNFFYRNDSFFDKGPGI